MRLNYGLHNAGWATVTLECADQRVEMAASYLHDSLRDLASAAQALSAGASEVRVLFMDEPGEHELVLRRGTGDTVAVEVWWHDDWKSWKMSSSPGTRRLFGSSTVAQVRDQVVSELKRLLRENGETGYREKWVEHGFPAEELRQLEEAG
jgi:hypothetical protein